MYNIILSLQNPFQTQASRQIHPPHSTSASLSSPPYNFYDNSNPVKQSFIGDPFMGVGIPRGSNMTTMVSILILTHKVMLNLCMKIQDMCYMLIVIFLSHGG